MAKIDLVGQKFNRLTVLEDTGKRNSGGNVIWKCQCECGNIKEVVGSDLKRNRVKSCGCLRRELASKDLTGQRFGRLLVLQFTDKINNDKRKIYKCKCDCGNICEVSSHNLSNGSTKSCGCLNIQKMRQRGLDSKRDLTGQKFGKLTVIEDSGRRGKKGQVYWLCKCDCGKETQVYGQNLLHNKVLSCGCLKQSKGQYKIQQILKENNINYQTQYHDLKCKLSTGGYAKFDFKINNSYYIEYDGSPHFFAAGNGWNTQQHLQTTQLRDKEKNEYCLKNNIPLIRIPYTHYNNLNIKDLLLNTTNYLVTNI